MQNEDTINFCKLINNNWDEECIQKLRINETCKRDQSISAPVGTKIQIHQSELISNSEIMIKKSNMPILLTRSDSKSTPNLTSGVGNENNNISLKTDVLKLGTETTNTIILNHSEDICDELSQALENPRERLNILKFEKDIKKFVEDPIAKEYFFPPLTSYQRFAVHHLAQRFQLNHMSLKTGNSENHGIYLSKTPSSSVPNKLLIDLVCQKTQEQQSTQEKKQPKLLTKENSKNKTKKTQKLNSSILQKQHSNSSDQVGSDCSYDQNNEANAKIKSVDERQKEYDDARARIFQESNSSSVGSLNILINKFEQENSQMTTPFVGSDSSSSNLRSKAMRRDREAEKFDPDFFRHSVPQRCPRPSVSAPSNQIPTQQQFFPGYPIGNNYQFPNVPLHHQPNMNGFPFNQSQSQQQQQQQQQYSSYFYNSQSFHPPAQTFQAPPSQQHSHQYQQMAHPNILIGSGNRYEPYQISPPFSSQQQQQHLEAQSRYQDHFDAEFPPLQKSSQK